MASAIDLGAIDREVRAAAKRRIVFDLESNPLAKFRRVSTRDVFLELRELPSDPWIEALAEWVGALTLTRVLHPDVVRLERALRDETVRVESIDRKLSPREAFARLLAERDPEMRSLYARGLERGAIDARDAARILDERRAEAAALLGVDDDALRTPCEPKTALDKMVAGVFASTEPFVEGVTRWEIAIERALGRSSDRGWPPKYAPMLFEMTRATELLAGIPAPAIATCPVIGAASFARAIASLGESVARADGPSSSPFAIAYAPFDLRVARRASLFASIAAEPAFHRRVLGLGRDRANEQAREVGRALATSLRLLASKVAFAGALSHASRFEEIGAAAFGAPVPFELAGVVPRLRDTDATTLLGAVLAARDRRVMIDRFDEDWFVNPEAALAIRGEDAKVGARREKEEVFVEALADLERACRELAA